MLFLDLLEIQQLVREVQQPIGVAVHNDQVLGDAPVHRLFAEDVLQRTLDQRQRRADLVRDVGEEADLGIVQLPFLLALESLDVLLLAANVAARIVNPNQHECTQRKQSVDDIGRHGEVERRRNLDEKPFLRLRAGIAEPAGRRTRKLYLP